MISVIVPVYKVEKYLARCVDSILAQTYGDLEIILVDDGSPDNCGALCDEYATKDSRVRVLHKSNGGISSARNAGIEVATGEFVCFIDSDDYIDASMLMTLMQLQKQYDADISCCGILDVYEGRSFTAVPEKKTFCCTGKEAFAYTLEGKYIGGSICNKLIRLKTLGDHRFELNKLYEDAFFVPALMFSARVVAVTTEPLYYYWHRAESITTAPFTKEHMDVVEAYTQALSFVHNHWPDLEELAKFRLSWANFIVLDRMLQNKNYKKYPQFSEVVKYLRNNTAFIVHCRYFQKTRRLAAVVLKLNVGLYRVLSKANSHRTKVYK